MPNLVSLDVPTYAVPQENLTPVNNYLQNMADIPPSRMFLIKKALKVYKRKISRFSHLRCFSG
jgi:hypothetical protein